MAVAIADSTLRDTRDATSIVLLAPATATNGKPSGASAGLATSKLYDAFGKWPAVVTIGIYSTAGSGTMTATCRLWGYVATVAGGKWLPCGPGADTTKGILNLTAAIGESDTDKLAHSETLDLPNHFERLYLEVTAIGGTSTSITAELIVGRDS